MQKQNYGFVKKKKRNDRKNKIFQMLKGEISGHSLL